MLNGVILLWFILVALSVAFVIYDGLTNTPVSWVQKLAWILVTFYTGPVGLFFYLLACRNPGPDLHAKFTAAHWKQALNSEMHCLAGDATGIILAAIVVSHYGLANGIDLIIEYLSAFVVGLLVFQALMMRSMYDNNYLQAVKSTFFAETVSMNMVMIGMIPVMVVLMHHWQGADNPLNLTFWFTMGLAAIAGGITAYPINSWLVKNKLKHGCMTLPDTSATMSMHRDNPAEHHHQHAKADADSMYGHEHSQHSMTTLPVQKAILIMLVTFAGLLLAAWLTSVFLAPISFR
jgi:uncharacterized protein DUF4396